MASFAATTTSMTVKNGHAPATARERQLRSRAERTRKTAANQLTQSVESRYSPPPCFFHRDCGGTAEIEKQGKAVCRRCSGGLVGTEYPLREPNREPLYRKTEELVLQLEMKEQRRKRSADA